MRSELEESQTAEQIQPIYIDVQTRYDDSFKQIEEMFADQKYTEVADKLKEAKYWEKMLDEID